MNTKFNSIQKLQLKAKQRVSQEDCQPLCSSALQPFHAPQPRLAENSSVGRFKYSQVVGWLRGSTSVHGSPRVNRSMVRVNPINNPVNPWSPGDMKSGWPLQPLILHYWEWCSRCITEEYRGCRSSEKNLSLPRFNTILCWKYDWFAIKLN